MTTAAPPPRPAPQLPTHVLRGTDIRCGILGFGCASLGGVYGDVDLDTCRATVHAAIAGGVTFFDTSPYYGNSETMLGKCLAGVPRASFVVATKCGRYGDGSNDGDIDFSAARTRASVLRSCERIGVECLDLVQCHDIEFADLDQVVNECLPELAKLRAEGRLRFIGISSYALEKLVCVLERSPLVNTIQTYCRLCLVDNTLLDMAPYFKGKGVGVINGSPLAMGLLTGRTPPAWHTAPDSLKRQCVEMATACSALGLKLPSVAIAYATSLPEACQITLMGTAKVSRMRDNIAAVTAPPPTKDYEAALRAVEKIIGASNIRASTRLPPKKGFNQPLSLNYDN